MPFRRDRSFAGSTLRLSRACLIATLVLVGTGTGKPKPAVADTSGPVPVLSQWTPTTQVYQNPEDGTLSATIASGPFQAHASSDTGWAPINTDLQSTANGLEPQATDADITFSDGTDATAPVATLSQ